MYLHEGEKFRFETVKEDEGTSRTSGNYMYLYSTPSSQGSDGEDKCINLESGSEVDFGWIRDREVTLIEISGYKDK